MAFPIGLAITAGTIPLNWALIGDLFGRRSYATLRGIMGVGYGVGTFISPIYAGWIFDRTGSYENVLLTFIVAQVLARFDLRRPAFSLPRVAMEFEEGSWRYEKRGEFSSRRGAI